MSHHTWSVPLTVYHWSRTTPWTGKKHNLLYHTTAVCAVLDPRGIIIHIFYKTVVCVSSLVVLEYNLYFYYTTCNNYCLIINRVDTSYLLNVFTATLRSLQYVTIRITYYFCITVAAERLPGSNNNNIHILMHIVWKVILKLNEFFLWFSVMLATR